MTTSLLPAITPTGKSYTLDDFSALVFSAVSYKLSNDVLSAISFLEANIEIPEFTPPTASSSSGGAYNSARGGGSSGNGGNTGNHPRHDYRSSKTASGGNSGNSNGRRGGSSRNPTAEDWELMRNFKTTKIEAKVGVEKTINDIRIMLNKMSTANYAKQSAAILDEVGKYMDHSDSLPENIEKIAMAIFSIASSNKFYSEIYAELYRELVEKFQVFDEILTKFVAGFLETIATIEYVDPDVNYDEFCRVNKANDNRKATSAFIVNLMKKGLIAQSEVARILAVLVDTVLRYIGEEGRIHVIEEITENVFIFVSTSHAELKSTTEWVDTVAPAVKKLSTAKPADHKSMSNRIMFKYMDMLTHVA